jgi:hypothetical protein
MLMMGLTLGRIGLLEFDPPADASLAGHFSIRAKKRSCRGERSCRSTVRLRGN